MSRTNAAGKTADPGSPVKKVVTLGHEGRWLKFRVSQELFSSHDIDAGSQLLLRTLTGDDYASRRLVLDLGCGYGPLGLALRAVREHREVHLVDRDALAVDFTRANAELNALDQVEAYGSLGYTDVRRTDFDLVVSNIPAKAGDAVIRRMLLAARDVMAPTGLVGVVVIDRLREPVAAMLDEASEVEVLLQKVTPAYTVFHYAFPESTTPLGSVPDTAPLEPYQRARTQLSRRGVDLELTTAWGLPEFDTLSFGSEMVVRAILGWHPTTPSKVLVVNPGQGYIPALLTSIGQARELRIVDRDLLALRMTAMNTEDHGLSADRISTYHQVDLSGIRLDDLDLAVYLVRPKEPTDQVTANLRTLLTGTARGAGVVLAATSTQATRSLSALEHQGLWSKADRKRDKGSSLVVLTR